MKSENLGNGIESTVNGDTLTLTVKLNRPGTPSASGKTRVLASTRGNVIIPGTDGITVGLNVYVKK
jgi:hypothetical protein